MKKITIIWTITLVVIVAGLTVIGFKIKEENINEIMEESVVEQAKKYLGMYPGLFPTLGKTIKLDAEKMKSEGYDSELEDGCTGYALVENKNVGFTYKGYIKCEEYTTKGYSEDD